MSAILNRRGPFVASDKSRVILRRMYPGSHEMARKIVDRVLALSDAEAQVELDVILDEWGDRHHNLISLLRGRYREIVANIGYRPDRPDHVKTLIGAYFSHEYSIESAALFNPSIVPHPNPTEGLSAGSKRVIISFRATGEGHISSVTFREAIINGHNRISLMPNLARLADAQRVEAGEGEMNAEAFIEMVQHVHGVTRGWTVGHKAAAAAVMENLPEESKFTLDDLRRACQAMLDVPYKPMGDEGDAGSGSFSQKRLTRRKSFEELPVSGSHSALTDMTPPPALAVVDSSVRDETVQSLLLLAESSYSVHFAKETELSQRVLFPSAPSQSNGIEDARFVRFHLPTSQAKLADSPTAGSPMTACGEAAMELSSPPAYTYYATFTAYNGRSAVPQLMQTDDFGSITFRVMGGNAICNKGMALFPRHINGKYWMLSRQDDETVMIMSSDSLFQWNDPVALIKPEQPWEAFKMGNCGSPVETPKGWLVLTHGVGPMRRYCIGAAMLALDDPTKVIGRMKEPLIQPNEAEREGYVPNVVYSCGCLLHNNTELIIPYAMSDSVSSFATVSLACLYEVMGL